MAYKIRLYSEEFGADIFEYDSEAEMLAGFARLFASATEHAVKDGIERELSVLISATRYEVQTLTVCDGWINTWTAPFEDESGDTYTEQPVTFATRAEAERALADHLRELAVEPDTSQDFDPDDYRVAEVGAK